MEALAAHRDMLGMHVASSSWERFVRKCHRDLRLVMADVTGPTISLGTFLVMGPYAHSVLARASNGFYLEGVLGEEERGHLVRHAQFVFNHFSKYEKLCLSARPVIEVSHAGLAEHLSELSEDEFSLSVIRGGSGVFYVGVGDEVFWYADADLAFSEFQFLQRAQSRVVGSARVSAQVLGYCVG